MLAAATADVAQDTDELSFQAGDSVRVLDMDEDGWWYAVHTRTGAKGFVPSNFLISAVAVAPLVSVTAIGATTSVTPEEGKVAQAEGAGDKIEKIVDVVTPNKTNNTRQVDSEPVNSDGESEGLGDLTFFARKVEFQMLDSPRSKGATATTLPVAHAASKGVTDGIAPKIVDDAGATLQSKGGEGSVEPELPPKILSEWTAAAAQDPVLQMALDKVKSGRLSVDEFRHIQMVQARMMEMLSPPLETGGESTVDDEHEYAEVTPQTDDAVAGAAVDDSVAHTGVRFPGSRIETGSDRMGVATSAGSLSPNLRISEYFLAASEPMPLPSAEYALAAGAESENAVFESLDLPSMESDYALASPHTVPTTNETKTVAGENKEKSSSVDEIKELRAENEELRKAVATAQAAASKLEKQLADAMAELLREKALRNEQRVTAANHVAALQKTNDEQRHEILELRARMPPSVVATSTPPVPTDTASPSASAPHTSAPTTTLQAPGADSRKREKISSPDRALDATVPRGQPLLRHAVRAQPPKSRRSPSSRASYRTALQIRDSGSKPDIFSLDPVDPTKVSPSKSNITCPTKNASSTAAGTTKSASRSASPRKKRTLPPPPPKKI